MVILFLFRPPVGGDARAPGGDAANYPAPPGGHHADGAEAQGQLPADGDGAHRQTRHTHQGEQTNFRKCA